MRGGGVDTVLIVYFRQIEDVRTRHTKATIATKPSSKPASAFCFGADTLCGNITANRPAGRLDARCKDPGGREPSPQGGGSGCGESGRGLLLGEASGRNCQNLPIRKCLSDQAAPMRGEVRFGTRECFRLRSPKRHGLLAPALARPGVDWFGRNRVPERFAVSPRMLREWCTGVMPAPQAAMAPGS
jgi:hypothetical protein